MEKQAAISRQTRLSFKEGVQYDSVLHTAAMSGSLTYVKAALKVVPVDQRDPVKKTALYYAARLNHVPVVRYLCSLGANAKIVKEDPEIAAHLNTPDRSELRVALNDAIILEPAQVRRQIIAAYQGIKASKMFSQAGLVSKKQIGEKEARECEGNAEMGEPQEI